MKLNQVYDSQKSTNDLTQVAATALIPKIDLGSVLAFAPASHTRHPTSKTHGAIGPTPVLGSNSAP